MKFTIGRLQGIFSCFFNFLKFFYKLNIIGWRERNKILSKKSITLKHLYLCQLSFGRKPQTIHCIGSHVTPLAKLLRCLCKRHIGCDSRINHCFGTFYTYNSIQITWRIVEKWYIDRLHTGCYPGAFRLRINMENMRLAGEYWLLAAINSKS